MLTRLLAVYRTSSQLLNSTTRFGDPIPFDSEDVLIRRLPLPSVADRLRTRAIETCMFCYLIDSLGEEMDS